MKKVSIFIACFILLTSCVPTKREVIIQRDTVYVNVTDSSLVTQLDSLCNKIDSLKKENEWYLDY